MGVCHFDVAEWHFDVAFQYFFVNNVNKVLTVSVTDSPVLLT